MTEKQFELLMEMLQQMKESLDEIERVLSSSYRGTGSLLVSKGN